MMVKILPLAGIVRDLLNGVSMGVMTYTEPMLKMTPTDTFERISRLDE